MVNSQASRPEPQGGVNVTVVESIPVRITQMSLIKESHRPTDKIHKQVTKTRNKNPSVIIRHGSVFGPDADCMCSWPGQATIQAPVWNTECLKGTYGVSQHPTRHSKQPLLARPPTSLPSQDSMHSFFYPHHSPPPLSAFTRPLPPPPTSPPPSSKQALQRDEVVAGVVTDQIAELDLDLLAVRVRKTTALGAERRRNDKPRDLGCNKQKQKSIVSQACQHTNTQHSQSGMSIHKHTA